MRGGNSLPLLIRKTEPKPIRIFLQDGSNDLNNYTGNWFIANQDMQSAFEYAGYDVKHEWGDGAHSSQHARAIFPDALRWLWRDYPAPIKANPEGKSRQDVFQTLIPGDEWQLVAEVTRNTDGPAVNDKGELFFSEPGNNRIHKVGLDGKVTRLRREHQRRERDDVRPRRPPLRRRDAQPANRRLRHGRQDRA